MPLTAEQGIIRAVVSNSTRRFLAFSAALPDSNASVVQLPLMIDEKERVSATVIGQHGVTREHSGYPAHVAVSKVVRSLYTLASMDFRLANGMRLPPQTERVVLFTGDTVQRMNTPNGWITMEKPHNLTDFFRMALAQTGQRMRIDAAVSALSVPVKMGENGVIFHRQQPIHSPATLILRTQYTLGEITPERIKRYVEHVGVRHALEVAGGLSFEHHNMENRSEPLTLEVINPNTGGVLFAREESWERVDAAMKRSFVFGSLEHIVAAAEEMAHATVRSGELYNVQTGMRYGSLDIPE